MTDVYDVINELRDVNFKFEEDSNAAMNSWEKYGLIKKDVFDGDTVKVNKINSLNGSKLKLSCENGISINCDLKRDKTFFKIIGVSDDINEIKEWLNSEDGIELFESGEFKIMISKNGHNVVGSLLNSHINDKCYEFLEQIKRSTKYYDALIIGKNTGGFIVDIAGVIAFLPGGQAAANKITDFDSYIGKTIPVMIEDYIKEGSTFIVSNKKYLKEILPIEIQNLKIGEKYSGTITGTVAFGIFIEFNNIFTGLIHMSEMDMNMMTKFKQGEYRAGENIDFYIKEILPNNKIILTSFELSEHEVEFTFEDFQKECENKVETGEIINIKENLGVFVKFTRENKHFIGLLYFKEIDDFSIYKVGDKKPFYISKVIAENKKIFLKVPIVK